MLTKEEQLKLAKEMAAKDKRKWEDLPEIMTNAYLHAAETDWITRHPPEDDEAEIIKKHSAGPKEVMDETCRPEPPPPDTDPGVIIKEGGLEPKEVKHDADSGARKDDKPAGSADTSKSVKPKKPKARKKAKAKTG